MDTCEVCGKSSEKLYLTRIEEANLWLCAECSRGKKILASNTDQNNAKTTHRNAGNTQEVQEDIVEHYGQIIRKAREKMGLELKVLAEKINEKESNLVRIEKESTLPSETTRMKLEKELGIKLTTKVVQDNSEVSIKRSEPITLWDAAFKKENDKDDVDGEN